MAHWKPWRTESRVWSTWLSRARYPLLKEAFPAGKWDWTGESAGDSSATLRSFLSRTEQIVLILDPGHCQSFFTNPIVSPARLPSEKCLVLMWMQRRGAGVCLDLKKFLPEILYFLTKRGPSLVKMISFQAPRGVWLPIFRSLPSWPKVSAQKCARRTIKTNERAFLMAERHRHLWQCFIHEKSWSNIAGSEIKHEQCDHSLPGF